MCILEKKMESTVVNVRVASIRPKYQNLKEWCADESNVYIGRARIVFIDGERYPPKDSLWANPFKTGTLDDRIKKYREHITRKFGDDLARALAPLVGKNLGCWCAPEPCHGHVLVSLMQECGLI